MSLQKISNILNNKSINLSKNIKLWNSYKTVYELGNYYYNGLYSKNNVKYTCSNYMTHQEIIIYMKNTLTNKDYDVYKLNQWLSFVNTHFFNSIYKTNQVNLHLDVPNSSSLTSLLQPSQKMFENIILNNINLKHTDSLIDFWLKSKEDKNRKVVFDDLIINNQNDYNPDNICKIVNTLEKYKPTDYKINLSNLTTSSDISEALVYPNFNKLIFGFPWYINNTISINYKNYGDIRYFDDNTKFLFFNRNFIYSTDCFNNHTLKQIEIFKTKLEWLYNSIPNQELYHKCYHKKIYLKYSLNTKYNKTDFDQFCLDLNNLKSDLNIKLTLYVPKYYEVSHYYINNNLISYY